MLKTILAWLTGPLTTLSQSWIEGRYDAEQAKIEREVKKDFLRTEIKKELLTDDGKRAAMLANIIRNDRGDNRTAWIRPVTAGMALVFWTMLTLSQMVWVGWSTSVQLLPIVWNIPPEPLGTMMVAFPMGVLASFYIARPFEKFFIGKGN